MKKSSFFLIFLFIPFLAMSQDRLMLTGKVIKSIGEHAVGDTILVYGTRINPNTAKLQYLVRAGLEFRNVNEDRIELVPHDFDYWEMKWFENRGGEIAKNGWENQKRQELHEDALDYYSQAIANKMVFQDDMLYDYLYGLLYQIHPTPMIKERTSNFSLIVLNSTEPTGFAFDNGMIVLTTGLIAGTRSEEDLVKLLSEFVAHSILEHNLVNLNRALKAERNARIWGTVAALATATAMAVDEAKNGTFHDYSLATDLGLAVYFLSANTLENIGAKYSPAQNSKASQLAYEFMRDFPEIVTLDDYEYTRQISSAITFTAWQEYHLKNYAYARVLAQKLDDMNLASDRDYLLLSRIQRKIGNDGFSNRLALDYIEKGRQKSLEPLIDFDKEEGMIYSRMNEMDKAQESFLKYRNHLLQMKTEGKRVDSELQMMNDWIQRRGVPISPVAGKVGEFQEMNK